MTSRLGSLFAGSPPPFSANAGVSFNPNGPGSRPGSGTFDPFLQSSGRPLSGGFDGAAFMPQNGGFPMGGSFVQAPPMLMGQCRAVLCCP